MSWTIPAVALALLVPLVTRGSYSRLLRTPFRWGGILLLGLAIQVALEVVDLPESRWHDVGFGLLVASYVLVLGAAVANLLLRGMGVVIIGVAMNALAIVVNQGMPVDVPASWAEEHPVEATVKHHPQSPDDDLLFLSDIVPIPAPFEVVVSFGDLVIAIGLCDVSYHASRRARRRGARAPDRRGGTAARRPANGGDGTEGSTVRGEAARLERSDGGERLGGALEALDHDTQRLDDLGVVDVARR